jgi:hypothetical protein
VTIVFEGRTTTFLCDCGAEYIDHLGGWNGGRAAMTRAKERGWSLRRVRVGQWRAVPGDSMRTMRHLNTFFPSESVDSRVPTNG